MGEREGKSNVVFLMIALAVAVTLLLGLAFCIVRWRSVFTWSEKTRKYDVYYYGVSGGQAHIYDVDKDAAGHLEIPETIEGMPVVTIGQRAFESLPDLTEVTIPDTVLSIGSSAFGSCPSLQKVTVGGGVRSIGNQVFCNCESLEEIHFRRDVWSMGEDIFDSRDEEKQIKVIIPEDASRLHEFLYPYEDRVDIVTTD